MLNFLIRVFVEQPSQLLSMIGSIMPEIRHIAKPSLQTQINAQHIPNITPQVVNKVINDMSSRKATGADGLSIEILKIAAPAILPSICQLINHCIDHAAWKKARMKPNYKSQNNEDDVGSYPISILAILSKTFEKHS